LVGVIVDWWFVLFCRFRYVMETTKLIESHFISTSVTWYQTAERLES